MADYSMKRTNSRPEIEERRIESYGEKFYYGFRLHDGISTCLLIDGFQSYSVRVDYDQNAAQNSKDSSGNNASSVQAHLKTVIKRMSHK